MAVQKPHNLSIMQDKLSLSSHRFYVKFIAVAEIKYKKNNYLQILK